METNIGKKISQLRKDKKITQQQIADFIGVTKASVSKWETGMTYPDITFLPLLAAFFDCSIDELMGYSELSKKEIENIYNEMKKKLTKNPQDSLKRIRHLVKRYWSCYPLVFSMASLMVNHIELITSNSEEMLEVMEESQRYVQHVVDNDTDEGTRVQAKMLLIALLLTQRKGQAVIDLVGDKPTITMPFDIMVAGALELEGRLDEAETVMQAAIYQNLVILLNQLMKYISIPNLSLAKIQQTLVYAEGMIETYEIESFHPLIVMMVYGNAAMILSSLDEEKAMDYLEKFVDMFIKMEFPVSLKGNHYFDKIDDWLAELPFGNQTPKNTMVIQEETKEVLLENPIFDQLRENPRFVAIRERIESAQRDEH